MGPASRVGPSGSGEAARKLLSKSTVAVTAVAVTVRVAAAVTVRVAAAVTVAVRVATVEWIKTSLTLWCAPR